MSGHRLMTAIGSAILIALHSSIALAAPSVPSLFVVDDVTPGAVWDTPVGITFLPGGRMLVAEKRGRVYTVTNGVRSVSPLWQAEAQVLDNGDRGLLGIAVDPAYGTPGNRWLYLLYTVDPDSNNVDTDSDAYGRLIRIQVLPGDSTVDYNSRQVLFGADWPRGPVSGGDSHTIGSLRFAADSTLIVSVGDGAQYNSMDQGGQDPGAFGAGKTDPNENIGAFRAQDITSLAGKILRLDRTTGRGLPSNPYWDGNANSVRSRVWAYGTRNPFRFSLRPGTGSTDAALGRPGTLYIGDVGWTTWEELDIARNGGINFGWPCFEGFGANGQYQAGSPAHNGCGSIGTATNPTSPSSPIAAWHHTDDAQSVPPGFHGNTSIGGTFYTSNRYPVQYRGQYFFGDFGQSWIRVAVVDANDNLIQVLPFGTSMDGPVDFALDPATGDLIYVAINVGGIRRIRYTGATGGNTPPIAIAAANPNSGAAPLTVNFSSSGSSDADGDPLAFSWLFGDGGSSSAANPTHVYASPGNFPAQLTVSDGRGGSDVRTLSIVVGSGSGAFPTTPVVDNFNRANGALGGQWVGQTTGLTISNNQLTSSSGAAVSAVWNGAVFGADQEVYVTFNAINAAAPEHDLMLKVQGTSYTGGHIEVRYTAAAGQVQVSTYTGATGWVNRGGPIAVTFGVGDRFGARALANGTIEVYRNGAQIGSTSAGTWPFAASGGRLGLTVDGITGSLLDDFGGGNVVANANTKPTAILIAPTNGSFYISGQTISLVGDGSDAQTPSDSLTYQWVMDLHHNTHVHPAAFTGFGKIQSYLGDNHDDGTGVFEEIKLIVADPGGLTDTARVSIYPEVDLTPSIATVAPATPTGGQPATYTFRLRNLGRMPAPFSRWVLRAGGTLVAQGDTLVPARDSVTITRTASLAAGTFNLRARADSLGTVTETDEGNDASNVTLTVNPVAGNTPPVANAGGAPVSGTAPLAVTFSSAGSSDPDGDPITFAWAFGDGGTSSAAGPAHTYVAAGSYNAVLTVSDNRGGSGRDTVVVTVTGAASGFPSTAVVDNFNRANGALGGQWVGQTTGLTISNNQLTSSSGAAVSAVWNGAVFGADQEVYVTFNAINAAAPEHDLMLKVQGTSYTGGHIEVRYTAAAGQVQVSTYTGATGWVNRGGPIAVTFGVGDRFGARALANGTIEVYRNGAQIGSTSAGTWPFAASGGRLGLTVDGITGSLLDDFGGGDVVGGPPPGNTPPVANAGGAPVSGTAPLAVTFSSAGSSDPDGDPITFAWAFGDGGTSSAAGPAHTYVAAGSYNAVLTVSDNRGGSGRDTVVVTVTGAASGFPSTAVVDNFNRANGALGGQWVGQTTGLTISNNQLTSSSGAAVSAVWNGAVFGADQEVYVTFNAINAAAPEHDLMLKVQGTSYTGGHIEVRYTAAAGQVQVSTYTGATGWVNRGGPIAVTFGVGDRFGARALANGTIEVYRNGAQIGSTSAGTWPFAASGGRLGLTVDGITGSLLDDFGGGDVVPAVASLGAQRSVDEAVAAPSLPGALALSTPWPNPASSGVTLALDLPDDADVRLSVLDVQGRRVMVGPLEHRPAGRWTLAWNGASAAGPVRPGIYLVQVSVGERQLLRRVVVLP